MSAVEERLTALGLELPPVSSPVANYVPAVRSGNLLFVAGQVPRDAGGRLIAGKVGDTMDVDTAYRAARSCALQALAVVKDAVGDLDRVARVVRVLGLVNATPDFGEQPAVVNGFSDLMVAAFGDAGRARARRLRRRLAPRRGARRGRVALRDSGLRRLTALGRLTASHASPEPWRKTRPAYRSSPASRNTRS